jgi:hypothetical protein
MLDFEHDSVMSTASKILVACLAIVGAIMVYGVVVHLFHFLVFAAVVIGLLYVASRVMGSKALGTGGRKSLP